jgi:DeoR/GlpR family transcriptional regulator of sugar metabolism
MLPNERQTQILQRLRDQGTVATEDLVIHFGVSLMTIHRDLDVLVRDGLAVKVHGGVTLPERVGKLAASTCQLCDQAIQSRIAFTIQVANGEPIQSCCPHCGILLLPTVRDVISVLTKDFLYGHTISAQQGIYLLDSTVTVCCKPSALCFASREDAARFQKGFGGMFMTFAEAQTQLSAPHLTSQHRSIHEHP